MNTPRLSRRSFLQSALAAGVAPLFLPSRVWSAETKPNSQLSLGFIGMGKQNGGHLNGFLGLDETVRKGAQAINVDVKLTSDAANREQLEELVRELPNNSPIHDTLANPVKIAARLV